MLNDRAPIRIVIADDHEVVRAGLRAIFEAEPDFEVVGEAADGSEAVAAAQELAPDVLLLDLRMPGADGLTVCRKVSDSCPDVHVLVLTSFDDDHDVFGALSGGACGYLLKDIAPDQLVQTIRSVATGSTVLDPAVADRVLAGDARRAGAAPALSARELEVLALMAEGLKNREIGERLWIGETTVKSHVSHIIDKLGQSDRTQAVVEAIRQGLVDVTRPRS